MDNNSGTASPPSPARPMHRPPSPPAFENRGFQHDEPSDPNHNDSFTSNHTQTNGQTNGHAKEPNGDTKIPEAVNLELINLTPKNGNKEISKKKDVEVDMNATSPYDEYFVPVNEHRKYMRGEKLYVTADKRSEKGGCKRPLCWTILGLVAAAVVVLIVLAATGVLFTSSPTPVEQYNSSISSARALGGISFHDHNDLNHNHDGHDHDHTNHDLSSEDLDKSEEVDHKAKTDSSEDLDKSEEEERKAKTDSSEDLDKSEEVVHKAHNDQTAKPDSSDDLDKSDEENHAHHDHTAHGIEQHDHDVAADSSMYVPRTIEGELRVDNENFTPDMADPDSDEYRQFTTAFSNALRRALLEKGGLDSENSDVTVEVIGLKEGSVIVTYRVHWKSKQATQTAKDVFTPESLKTDLDNYLSSNNRMISVYHIAEDDQTPTKPVVDLCQINNNDCEHGCEFDDATLEFTCTCPQGQMLNMMNIKQCVPYLDMHHDTHEQDPSAEPEPSSEPVPEPEVEPNAQPEPTAEPKAEPEAQAEPEPAAEPKAEPEPEPTAEPKAEPEPTAEPKAEPEPTAEPKAESESVAEPMAEPEPTAEPKAEPEPTAEPKAEPEPTAEPKAEPEPTAEPKAELEPTAEPKAEPEPSAEPKAEPEPTAEPKAEPEPTAEPELEPEPSAEPKAEPEPVVEPESHAEHEPTVEPKAEHEPSAEPKAEPEPTAEPKAAVTEEPKPETTSNPGETVPRLVVSAAHELEHTTEPQAEPEPSSDPAAEPQPAADNSEHTTTTTLEASPASESQPESENNDHVVVHIVQGVETTTVKILSSEATTVNEVIQTTPKQETVPAISATQTNESPREDSASQNESEQRSFKTDILAETTMTPMIEEEQNDQIKKTDEPVMNLVSHIPVTTAASSDSEDPTTMNMSDMIEEALNEGENKDTIVKKEEPTTEKATRVEEARFLKHNESNSSDEGILTTEQPENRHLLEVLINENKNERIEIGTEREGSLEVVGIKHDNSLDMHHIMDDALPTSTDATESDWLSEPTVENDIHNEHETTETPILELEQALNQATKDDDDDEHEYLSSSNIKSAEQDESTETATEMDMPMDIETTTVGEFIYKSSAISKAMQSETQQHSLEAAYEETEHVTQQTEGQTTTVSLSKSSSENVSVLSESEKSKGNLNVTIYEVSSHSDKNATTAHPVHSSEYEDHETEMNPFLPEVENNKSLVKKLQEGHDLEPANVNETQNENAEEHPAHITIAQQASSSDSPTTVKSEAIATTTTEDASLAVIDDLNSRASQEKSAKDITEDSAAAPTSVKSKESSDMPASKFLSDTDDLVMVHTTEVPVASMAESEIPSSTDASVSGEKWEIVTAARTDDVDDYLSVVPIVEDKLEEEKEKLRKFSKSESLQELNDISDSPKKSDRRTLNSINIDAVTNNEA